jgi:hypothetical protein
MHKIKKVNYVGGIKIALVIKLLMKDLLPLHTSQFE